MELGVELELDNIKSGISRTHSRINIIHGKQILKTYSAKGAGTYRYKSSSIDVNCLLSLGSWLAPYMYPSYPPPIPLWAIGKPRRKFVPYFGKHYTTTTTTTTTTAPKPAVLDSSCSHLPSTCWNNSPYLPLPIECIGRCKSKYYQISRMDDGLIS